MSLWKKLFRSETGINDSLEHRREIMTEQLITSDEVSIELLKKLFEDAYFETSIDKDGDLMIKGRYRCYVELPDSRRFIRFYAIFKPSDQASHSALINYANRINMELIVLRMYATEKSIGFDQYVWLEGGVTKKNVVMAFKIFNDLVQDAINRDKEDLFP